MKALSPSTGWSVCLLLGLPLGAYAQAVPVGPEFVVAAEAPGIYGVHGPSVSVGGTGAFVVVWHSYMPGLGPVGVLDVEARRYGADGVPLGARFQVNSYTTGKQYEPRVAVGGGGEFVVVWAADDYAADGSYADIVGRRFGSDGVPLGGEFQVNTYTTDGQTSPAVVVGQGGDFLVVWDTPATPRIRGRYYASDGSALSGELELSSGTQGRNPAVAVGPTGDVVVAWEESPHVRARRYASTGAALGAEFQVNTYTTGWQWLPSAAYAPSGEFIVTWLIVQVPDIKGVGIRARRFDPGGNPIGDDFQVQGVAEEVWAPSVAVGQGGDALAAWTKGSPLLPSTSSNVSARYGHGVSGIGGEFMVNTYTTGLQGFPSVSAGPKDFVAVWVSQPAGSGDDSIRGQRFAGLIFVDGFESGDVSAWSAALP